MATGAAIGPPVGSFVRCDSLGAEDCALDGASVVDGGSGDFVRRSFEGMMVGLEGTSISSSGVSLSFSDFRSRLVFDDFLGLFIFFFFGEPISLDSFVDLVFDLLDTEEANICFPFPRLSFVVFFELVERLDSDEVFEARLGCFGLDLVEIESLLLLRMALPMALPDIPMALLDMASVRNGFVR